jgi:hypothetical protein
MFVAPQNLIEFWSVATRPRDANGLGMTLTQAATQIARIKRLFFVLSDRADIYPEWEQLVMQYQVVGKKVHDARLVATMNVYGIQGIVTLNVADFSRYTNIHAVAPQTALEELRQAR